MFEHPCYVVLELPDPVAAQVLALRRRYDARLAGYPAEITLAGSSGLGTLATGQSETGVFDRLQALAHAHLPLPARFVAIRRFATGPVIWLQPEDPAPLEAFHRALAGSGLAFQPHRFAYTPHCSLSTTTLAAEQQEHLLAEAVPAERFILRRLALYEVVEGRPALLRRFEAAPSRAG